jgi:hypothetical protein
MLLPWLGLVELLYKGCIMAGRIEKLSAASRLSMHGMQCGALLHFIFKFGDLKNRNDKLPQFFL